MVSKSSTVKQLVGYFVGFWQRGTLIKQFKNGNGLFQANMLQLIIYGVSENVYHDNTTMITHVKHQRATRSVLFSEQNPSAISRVIYYHLLTWLSTFSLLD